MWRCCSSSIQCLDDLQLITVLWELETGARGEDSNYPTQLIA